MSNARYVKMIIGIILFSMIIVGCKTKIATDKNPDTFVSSNDQPTTSEPDSGEYYFNLSVKEPMTGKIIATRVLNRQHQAPLESKIEWPVQIKPVENGIQISSSLPEISLKHARLPEDAMNQLLIGRMFLISGVLDDHGIFHSNQDTSGSIKGLYDSILAAGSAQLNRNRIKKFLDIAFSENNLETTTREYWKTMVNSPIGKTLKIGVEYESEEPSDAPLGGSMIFVTKLKLVSEVPCADCRKGQKLVRIESHSQPKNSLKDLIRSSDIPYLPAGVEIEQIDITIDMVQVIDPSTLIPYSLNIVRTSKMEFRLPNGKKISMREVSNENWECHWDDKKSSAKL